MTSLCLGAQSLHLHTRLHNLQYPLMILLVKGFVYDQNSWWIDIHRVLPSSMLQGEVKGRALIDNPFCRDLAAVAVNDALDGCQPDADTLELCRAM